jgi:hypothetical protein
MEKKAISAPEKNADNPRQIKTARKSIVGGLAYSSRASAGGRDRSGYLISSIDYGEEWNQKMLRGINSLGRHFIVNAMS